MLDTYCDNARLKDAILNAPTPKGKLYPHELAMLFYCSIGHIKIASPSAGGVFHAKLYVDFPLFLLYSLIQRGYVRQSEFSENIGFFNTRDMQQFVKNHGIKSSSKRDDLADIIRKNFSEEEIRYAFPDDYYVPTDAGNEELRLSGYSILNAYDGWPRIDNLEKRSVEECEISVISPVIKALHIETDGESYKCVLLIGNYEQTIGGGRVIKLPKQSDLEIQINGQEICVINSVDYIWQFCRKKVLVFETKIKKYNSLGQLSSTSSIATGFDISTGQILYREELYKTPGASMTPDKFIASRIGTNSCPIRHDGNIDYYVSVHVPIIKTLLKDYIQDILKEIKVTEIPNFLKDDITQNIIISVSETNKPMKRFIHFLAKKKYISVPFVMNVGVNDIARQLYLREMRNLQKTKTGFYLMEDDIALYPESAKFISEMEVKFSNLRLLEEHIWNYPIEVLRPMDTFRYYEVKDDCSGNDENWEYVNQHEKKLKSNYDKCILDMKKRGLIPTKWINELNLYVLIESIFPDAEYQYRCSWLGQQSFDIFIPSKKLP